jgi:hypothetical protein
MRWLLVVLALWGCGQDPDFQVQPLPDMRVTLDLASSFDATPRDLTCFNLACGACSTWANYDGTPVRPGDPCLWKGVWQCVGGALACSDDGCPACGGAMTGSVCGADGHTILEIIAPAGVCQAYDFRSAIAVCNHGADDHCVGRCVKNSAAYACQAACVADDGGATGCEYRASDTCESLTGC